MIKVTIKDTKTNQTTKYNCEGIIYAANSKNGVKVGIMGGFSILDLYFCRGQITDTIKQAAEKAAEGDGVIE